MIGKRMLRLLVCLCALLGAAGCAAADEIYVETSLEDASEAQRTNIMLAAMSVDGTRLGFGEEFSFNGIVGERTERCGFVSAPNGRGVEVVGGGVAQVATTLYLALMQRDDIEYSSIYTYNERFTGSYVESGYDAIATDYVNDLDFAFNSYYEGRLAVYMWLDEDALCCYVAEESANEILRPDDCDGFAVTPMAVSGEQAANIELAAMSVDSWRMFPGESFSFNEIVGPRKTQYGYRPAINGRGVEVIGGGVAQVAATVYLAVRDMDNVEITEMRAYGDSYSGSYVENGEDAVLVDYTGGIDFSFEYQGEDELTIYLYIEEDQLICEIYEN